MNQKFRILALVTLALVCVASVGCSQSKADTLSQISSEIVLQSSEEKESSKEKQVLKFTFLIIDDEGKSLPVNIETDKKTLGEALLENKLVKGDKGEYGLFVTEVNGIAADQSKEQWWCFSKNGTLLTTGIDSENITDSAQYEAVLKTGYCR